MVVYIKGMSKPKSCTECPFKRDGECLAREEADNFDSYHQLYQHCPLIEIVRCGECIHHDEDGWGYGECKRPSVDYLRTADEDFCSYGERRADEKMVSR